MNVHHWRQAHNIIGDTRNALNIEQLLKLEYLEQADSLLLDMGIKAAYDRGEHLEQRFKLLQVWADFVEECSQGSLPQYHLKVA